MPGIVFFGTTDTEHLVEFYADVGFERWLEQPDCIILRYDNLLVGFCERETADTDGVVTVVVDDRAAVDDLHRALDDVARGPPGRERALRHLPVLRRRPRRPDAGGAVVPARDAADLRGDRARL